jgi:ribosome-binding protein aMBF1 (putative translation factor)
MRAVGSVRGASTAVARRRECDTCWVPSAGTGERIAVYRRRRGLSQAALAGLVGRSESWLSQVERGIRSVDRLCRSCWTWRRSCMSMSSR